MIVFRSAWGIGGCRIPVGIDGIVGIFQFPKREDALAAAGNADSNTRRRKIGFEDIQSPTQGIGCFRPTFGLGVNGLFLRLILQSDQ